MSQRPYNKRTPPHHHKGHPSNGERGAIKKIERSIREYVKRKSAKP